MSDGLLGFWPQKDRSLRSEPLGCFGRGRQGLTARLLNRTFALTNRLEHVLRTSGSIDLVKELPRAGAYLPMHCACMPYLSIDAQKKAPGPEDRESGGTSAMGAFYGLPWGRLDLPGLAPCRPLKAFLFSLLPARCRAPRKGPPRTGSVASIYVQKARWHMSDSI